MATAPEPYLSACLAVLQHAILQSRAWGWSGEVSPDHLADLMDAVHNLPSLINGWEHCDVDRLRRVYLRPYQERWAGRGGLALCDIFDEIIASGAGFSSNE